MILWIKSKVFKYVGHDAAGWRDGHAPAGGADGPRRRRGGPRRVRAPRRARGGSDLSGPVIRLMKHRSIFLTAAQTTDIQFRISQHGLRIKL